MMQYFSLLAVIRVKKPIKNVLIMKKLFFFAMTAAILMGSKLSWAEWIDVKRHQNQVHGLTANLAIVNWKNTTENAVKSMIWYHSSAVNTY